MALYGVHGHNIQAAVARLGENKQYVLNIYSVNGVALGTGKTYITAYPFPEQSVLNPKPRCLHPSRHLQPIVYHQRGSNPDRLQTQCACQRLPPTFLLIQPYQCPFPFRSECPPRPVHSCHNLRLSAPHPSVHSRQAF